MNVNYIEDQTIGKTIDQEVNTLKFMDKPII